MTLGQVVGALVVIAVVLFVLRETAKRRRLLAQVQAVGPEDAEPEVLAFGLLGMLLTEQFGFDEDARQRCGSHLTDQKLAAALGDPLLAYVCLLYRDAIAAVYGDDVAAQAWEYFYGEVEALQELDDESAQPGGWLALWIVNLEHGETVSRSLDPDRMEALEFSDDMCLALGVWHVHKERGLESLWSDDGASEWLHQLEEVGKAFANARSEVGNKIRMSVQLLGIEEHREGLRRGLEDRPIRNRRVVEAREQESGGDAG